VKYQRIERQIHEYDQADLQKKHFTLPAMFENPFIPTIILDFGD